MPQNMKVKLKEDPAKFALEVLENFGETYYAFRERADNWKYKKSPISFRTIASDLRYKSKEEMLDYKINNSVTSLFARIYKLERPEAWVETRHSVWEELSAYDLHRIHEAALPLLEKGIVKPEGVS